LNYEKSTIYPIGIIITLGYYAFNKENSYFKKVAEPEFIMEQQDIERPETSKEFQELSTKAYEYLQEQQKIAEDRYEIGKYENWFYDQETGYLTFSDGDIAKIKIKYESTGSISKISDTWLWSWGNPHLEDKIKSDILKIKKYGEKHNFEPLTKKKWKADEYDGWEMTAIAAFLMKAKGAYRVPTENTYSFMIFKEIIDLRTEQ